MKKIFVYLCICILLFCDIGSIAKNTERKPDISNINNKDDSNYWAVLVYTNVTNITSIYNSIIDKSNWNESNIILLRREEATRENIFDALDWLRINANLNDTILFSFNGHGTYRDRRYGISPWDRDIIFTDELDERLDLITCKYTCLIFDCCFSGGFVSDDSIFYRNLISARFDYNFKLNLDDENRVVLMSSGRRGGGFIASVFEDGVEADVISFTRFVADGLEIEVDYNSDGWVSAEESFLYGRRKFMPYAIILFLFIPLQIVAFIQSRGYFLIPFPSIYDGVEDELLLVQI